MSLPDWLIWYVIISVAVITCADILRRYYNFRYLLHQQTILLELTPPAATRKAPLATEHLFTAIHVVGHSRSWKEVLLGRTRTFSFETVSSRGEGIRYLVRLAESDAPIFQQQLAAYLPDVRFQQVEDYLDTSLTEGKQFSTMEFKQARHFAFPLASHDSLSQHDPIAYITGSMTKLAPDELIAFQLVLAPVSPREATSIRNKLILGKDPNLYAKSRPLWLRCILLVLSVPFLLLKLVLGMISTITEPTYNSSKRYSQKPAATPYTPSPEHQELLKTLSSKLAQQLFQVSIRTLIISEDETNIQQRAMGLSAALGSFAVPGYQGIVRKSLFPRKFKFRYWMHGFENRLPSIFMRDSAVLAISEVASLYHFPYGDTARPENMITSHSRTLPAPASLKHLSDTDGFDVVLGVNKHHGSTTPIGLTASERERHIYVVGGTGNGKTTMLQYAIVQDIQNGKGVAVVDPHGDLAETILRYIPEDRLDDVIYLNPQDIDFPIALNLLDLPSGLTESQMALEQDFVTESIVSIFRKTFSEDDTGGHRIEYILRNTIHTAFTVPEATLYTLYDLLTDPEYRNSVTSKLTDTRLKQFWDNEFGKAGNMQRVKMASGVTNKLGRFDRSAVVKRVMEQSTSTIDFDDILASNKILICNFAKGSIGEDTTELFGVTVLAKLQLAALRRVRITQSERTPFYLYVDEFQHFATMSFLQMLSEARKYKLFLTMAEQSTAQQAEQRLVHIILDNVGTLISFRVRAASEQLLLPNFQPHIETGEIASLAAYHYYIRINGLDTHEPMSGETIVLKDSGSSAIANRSKARSREHFGRVYVKPEPRPAVKPEASTKPAGTSKKQSFKKPMGAMKHSVRRSS